MASGENIDTQGMRIYLERYRAALVSSAAEFCVPPYAPPMLGHALLPCKMIGYVSTTFGAAVEYVKSDTDQIEIVRSSKRVEDMLFDAPKELQFTAPAFELAGTGGVLLTRCSFANKFPLRLVRNHSSAMVVHLDFTFKNWRRQIECAEIFGDRSTARWDAEKASGHARSLILEHMMLSGNATKRGITIGEQIAKFREKYVLVLGDYGAEGMMRLRAICESLTRMGYEPFIVSEVPEAPNLDLQQKLTALGSLVRFVVVDDSSPAGQLAELPTCISNRWVIGIIRLHGKGGSAMTSGLSNTSRVVLELAYELALLDAAIGKVVNWAEATLADQAERNSRAYPWRV